LTDIQETPNSKLQTPNSKKYFPSSKKHTMSKDYSPPPPDKDPKLWAIAQRRASFKSHLISYVVMNAFFWVIWYLTNRGGYPWPVWPAFGWGIGLAFHYVSAYVNPHENQVEKEYEKLQNEKK
jgi:2TM domain